MLNTLDYKREYQLLTNNQSLTNEVKEELILLGLNNSLKGFLYLTDIITLMLLLKKYTRSFICEIDQFIAHKYNIKRTSVQRQLRYVCTISTNGKYKAIEVVAIVYNKIRQRMIERGE